MTHALPETPRRTSVVLGILLLLGPGLASVARADDAPVAPAPARPWLETAWLEARLVEACDAVAAEIGTPFRKRPTLVVTDAAALEVLLEGEMRGILEGPLDVAPKDVPQVIRLLAQGMAAKYAPATHTVHVAPASLQALADVHGTAGQITADTYRVLLAHEAAHAHDFERFPSLETERQGRRTADGVLVVGAVLEGHAQFVAERVARTWGIGEAFQKFTTLITSSAPSEDPAVRVMQDLVLADHRFAYVQGHAFMKAVHAAQGREGLDRVLAAPPKAPRLIERPQEYLGQTAARPAMDPKPAEVLVARALTGDGWMQRTQVFKRGQLAAAINILPAETKDPLVAGFDDGRVVMGQHAGEGRLVLVSVLRFQSPEMAQACSKAMLELLKAKDKLFEASTQVEIEQVEYGSTVGRGEGRPGVRSRKTVRSGGAAQFVEMQATTTGDIYVECTWITPAHAAAQRDTLVDALVAVLEGGDLDSWAEVVSAAPGDEASPTEVVEETPETEDRTSDLVGLARRFRAARERQDAKAMEALGASIAPTDADVAALTRDDDGGPAFRKAFAEQLARQGDGLATALGAKLFHAPADRTEIRAYAATTEALAAQDPAPNEFPGGMARFAQRAARAGITWYVLEITEPGKDAGTKFSCFAWLEGRFVFLPKPWRGVPRTPPSAEGTPGD